MHDVKAIEEENEKLRKLIVRLDGYLTLVQHRYQGRKWPPDLEREVDQLIGEVRRITK